jgi:hypothetical protein
MAVLDPTQKFFARTLDTCSRAWEVLLMPVLSKALERWTLTPDARARTKGYPLVTDGPMLNGEIAVVPEAEVERLRKAITVALRSHIYTFSMPDEDGNVYRAEKVERILREALDA